MNINKFNLLFFRESNLVQIPAKELSVILGAYDRERYDEDSRQYHKITSITYPKRINDCKLHDIHDLSLLRTQKEILFTLAISPVCLPKPERK